MALPYEGGYQNMSNLQTLFTHINIKTEYKRAHFYLFSQSGFSLSPLPAHQKQANLCWLLLFIIHLAYSRKLSLLYMH